eukprot:6201100-Pleurochrysis_carterae.AAC.1
MLAHALQAHALHRRVRAARVRACISSPRVRRSSYTPLVTPPHRRGPVSDAQPTCALPISPTRLATAHEDAGRRSGEGEGRERGLGVVLGETARSCEEGAACGGAEGTGSVWARCGGRVRRGEGKNVPEGT